MRVLRQYEPFILELDEATRYVWCQCGVSMKQPFCDGNSHRYASTPAPCLPPATRSQQSSICPFLGAPSSSTLCGCLGQFVRGSHDARWQGLWHQAGCFQDGWRGGQEDQGTTLRLQIHQHAAVLRWNGQSLCVKLVLIRQVMYASGAPVAQCREYGGVEAGMPAEGAGGSDLRRIIE